MSDIVSAVDLLEEVVSERKSLHGAISRTDMLMTRVKISWGGAAASDILLHELINEMTSKDIEIDSDTKVHNRLTGKGGEKNDKSSRGALLTRDQQVQSLRTAYAALLHEHLIPFAQLQMKLNGVLREL